MTKQTYDQLVAIARYRKPTYNNRNVPEKLVQIVKNYVAKETDIEWGEIVCCYQWGLTTSKDEIDCEFVYKVFNSDRTHKVYMITFSLNDVNSDWLADEDERYDYVTSVFNLTEKEY